MFDVHFLAGGGGSFKTLQPQQPREHMERFEGVHFTITTAVSSIGLFRFVIILVITVSLSLLSRENYNNNIDKTVVNVFDNVMC